MLFFLLITLNDKSPNVSAKINTIKIADKLNHQPMLLIFIFEFSENSWDPNKSPWILGFNEKIPAIASNRHKVNTNEIRNPSIVLLGEILGANLCLPKKLPPK